MPASAGTKIGECEILGLLGSGGMGEVYRARDHSLGREVALKLITEDSALDPERIRRFEQEARAAAALNHPNILAIYRLGTTAEGSAYIISELLEGQGLRQRLESGTIPLRRVLDYSLQIARGLTAAHERGVVHRDLKPENLFITRDGVVKILDFGLAKLRLPAAPHTDAATVAGTEAGMVLGTLGYMSPEQLRAQPVDGRSDIFSFGAVLYEMVSGQRAFPGITAADTISAILTRDPPELNAAGRDVPLALSAVVHRCLEKEPGAFSDRARPGVQPGNASGSACQQRHRRCLGERAPANPNRTACFARSRRSGIAVGAWIRRWTLVIACINPCAASRAAAAH